MANEEKRALVVDDDVDLRQAICDYLAGKGWTVRSAASGDEAYTLLEAGLKSPTQDRVDVIVSDLRMSGGDGMGLLHRVRHGPFRDCAFLLISGYASEHDFLEAMRGDADGVLQKPFGNKLLMEKVESALREREVKEARKSLLS